MERAFPEAASVSQAGGSGIDPQLAPASKPEFGDFQANGALPLAKPLGQPPRAIAHGGGGAAEGGSELYGAVPRAQIAGPGFINLTLQPRAARG